MGSETQNPLSDKFMSVNAARHLRATSKPWWHLPGLSDAKIIWPIPTLVLGYIVVAGFVAAAATAGVFVAGLLPAPAAYVINIGGLLGLLGFVAWKATRGGSNELVEAVPGVDDVHMRADGRGHPRRFALIKLLRLRSSHAIAPDRAPLTACSHPHGPCVQVLRAPTPE